MNLVEFPEQTVVMAKDQPDYCPMPAHMVRGEAQGTVTCCWKLSWRERFKVFFGGVIWHQIMTFQKPLQPQLLLADKPALERPEPKPEPYAPAKMVRCRRCGVQFDEIDKWVLCSERNVVSQPFCSKVCAEAFSADCIGDLVAKPLSR